MPSLHAMLAGHPLPKKPYNAIKFVRFDHNGTPLYVVGKDKKTLGAAAALKAAFESYGAHCFHCGKWMCAQPLSQECNRDHLRPRRAGGREFLYNLVFSCGSCNREKGGADLISFRPEAGLKYLTALEEHLAKCIRKLANETGAVTK